MFFYVERIHVKNENNKQKSKMVSVDFLLT